MWRQTMINIQDIIPLMKDGWVAMDENGWWWWHSKKPRRFYDQWDNNDLACNLRAFDIAPADDWTKSLRKVGGK